MNSENAKSTGIFLVLIGIMLQLVDWPVDLGLITINLLSDIVAYIIILIGLKPFFKEQNRIFSDCFKKTIILLVVETLNRLSTCIDFHNSNATVSYLFLAATSILFMQLVYSFTEALVWQAKFLKIELNIPSLKISFSAFCILIILYFVVATFSIPILTVVANVLLVFCGMYYCGSVNSVKDILYPVQKDE